MLTNTRVEKVKERQEYPNYLIPPNKFKFEKMIRILLIVRLDKIVRLDHILDFLKAVNIFTKFGGRIEIALKITDTTTPFYFVFLHPASTDTVNFTTAVKFFINFYFWIITE